MSREKGVVKLNIFSHLGSREICLITPKSKKLLNHSWQLIGCCN